MAGARGQWDSVRSAGNRRRPLRSVAESADPQALIVSTFLVHEQMKLTARPGGATGAPYRAGAYDGDIVTDVFSPLDGPNAGRRRALET